MPERDEGLRDESDVSKAVVSKEVCGVSEMGSKDSE
jgi:hypothetical protein